jgi:hypothetical protein
MTTSSIARPREVSAESFVLPRPSGPLSINAARELALIELDVERPRP